MIKVSVVGVPGYTAIEGLRLLARRQDVQLVEVVGRSAAGQALRKIVPSLGALSLIIKGELEQPQAADFVFLCLPHHESAEWAARIFEASPQTKVIDFSADFRLRDVATYEKWYGKHPAPYLLKEAVYGLPELYRGKVTIATRLVANPGCYPTCSSLALAPALAGAAMIEPQVVINALSGTSGAGRGLKQNLHFSEMHDSASAYGLDGHRHTPEIEQILGDIHGSPVSVMFVPHLIPVARGMLATVSAPLVPNWLASQAEPKVALVEHYKQFYEGCEFVRIVDAPPTIKEVFGTNYCFIYPTLDLHTNRLLIVAVLDNMVKGAAGAAVQSMNLMAGLPETTGLNALAIYP